MAEKTAKGKAEKLDTEKRGKTFRCRFCERSRPLSEMTVVARFFPPVVACRECERKIR